MLDENLYRFQPLKSIHITYRLTSLLVRLPWVSVKYIVPSLRPRPAWSYKISVTLYVLREFSRLNQTGGPVLPPTHLELEVSNGANGVWVDPVPEFVLGKVKEWAEAASVEPVTIPCYWFDDAKKPASPDWKPSGTEKVLYYVHGGAYVAMSARPSNMTSRIPRAVLEACPSIKRAFSLDYRVSIGAPFTPQNPFPTALVDALAGYNYLINVKGYSPSSIIIFGDSAGGHLVHTLTRYLIQYPIPSLPLPGGIAMISPWVNIGVDPSVIADPSTSYVQCANTDFLLPNLSGDDYAAKAFAGPLFLQAQKNEYIAPASASLEDISFKGFPRTFISSGEAELFRDQIRTFHTRMQRDLGDQVTYCEVKDAVHDVLAFDFLEPYRTQTYNHIATWVEKV